jgi:hypothetical protein
MEKPSKPTRTQIATYDQKQREVRHPFGGMFSNSRYARSARPTKETPISLFYSRPLQMS